MGALITTPPFQTRGHRHVAPRGGNGGPRTPARALKIGEHVEPWSKVPRAAARTELPTLVGNSMLPQVPGKAAAPLSALSQLKP